MGKKTYINGVLSGQSSNVTKFSNLTNLAIGKGYQGEIGELIGFNRALKDNEIKDTTNYLSAKWSEPAYVGVSCTNGTITASGCSLSGCSLSEPGTSTTNVETGEGSLNCTSPGFSGTINYTCSDGVFSKTTSCSSPLCTITSVAGLNNKTNLAYATTATAIPNTPTAACATGYSGSPTYTCTATGAATITANCSPITCSITSVTGLNNKTNLAYAASATAIPSSPCAAGFSGSPTYTCTATGAATITANCTPITCSITSVTGLNNKTGLAYAASATAIPSTPTTACATGYSGSPTYTCMATGAATVVSGCSAAATAHWVLATSVADRGFVTSGAPYFYTMISSATCDASVNQKYMYKYVTSTTPSPSVATWTAESGGYLYGWLDCYHTAAGDTPSGCSAGKSDVAGYNGAYNKVLYQCQFY